MRKKKTLFFLAVAFALLLSANTFAAAPKLNRKSVTMEIGQKTNGKKGILLKVKNADRVKSWFTDDPTVANIAPDGKQCRVYGIGYGTATITVKADGKKLTCKIKVKDPQPGLRVPMPYSGYKKLTKKAKGRASDALAIAESQAGYVGAGSAQKGVAYYGSKWSTYVDNKRQSGAWCSDFVSWCLCAARVPDQIGLYAVRNGYHKSKTVCGYFSKSGSLYRYKPAYRKKQKEIDNYLKGYEIAGTLTEKTVRPGDVGIVNYGSHAVFIKKVNTRDGSLWIVEGNCSNRALKNRCIRADEVVAIARPAYTG